MSSKYIFIPILFLPLLFFKCFPTYQAKKVNTDSLRIGSYSDIQAKVFKADNTVILFPAGYSVNDRFIIGEGIIADNNSFRQIKSSIKLPLDSIIAMTDYEETTSGGRYFGSFLLGLTGPPLLALGVYCVACPKCCFGSCPTIYTYDGKDYNFEAELFSECISKQLEDKDIDLLKQKIQDNNYNLKITNEAMETHYINKFEIVVAEHPLGTELYPAIDNSLLLFSEIINASAISKDGKDITNLLQHDDNKFYRSGVEKVSELKKGTLSDWIEIKIPAVKNSPSKMLLKYRNTLLSTTLLYNVVIGSQGAGGLAWTKKMNEDAQYASQFKMIYEAFSGVKLTVFEDGIWKTCGKFKDAGPLSWKYLAAKLPPVKSDTLLIRLEFIPDNFMIDYVAFDITSSVDKITASIVYPCGIMDGSGTRIDSLLNYIKDDDTQYLKTEPGDSYCLNYRIPAVKSCESTVLIYSKGYYNEWIRGGWISSKDNYTFNLFDIEGTLSELADSWIENSELLESEFFQSRFSLREEK